MKNFTTIMLKYPIWVYILANYDKFENLSRLTYKTNLSYSCVLINIHTMERLGIISTIQFGRKLNITVNEKYVNLKKLCEDLVSNYSEIVNITGVKP